MTILRRPARPRRSTSSTASRSCCRTIKAGLPKSLELEAVGDQSKFVNDAVDGVMREGVIAATLTGLMILIFLGSWRSTIIIMVSIPLAILFSVAVLSAIGETINVMTLGGLALAVGILVDDGTVTIENINFHLEQGKPIEDAIMDGSRQIVMPATVSLLCDLHRVRADVHAERHLRLPVQAARRGRDLRARRLLHAVAHAGADDGELPARQAPSHHEHGPRRTDADAQPAGQIPARVRASPSRGCAPAIRTILDDGARAPVAASWSASFWPSSCRSGLCRILGRNFFPNVQSAQIKLHVRAPTGTRIEETAKLIDDVEATSCARSSRRTPSRASSTTSACRSAASTSPTAIPARSASSTAMS